MFNILKKNSIILGIVAGTITPVALYFLLSFLVDALSLQLTWGIQLVQDKNIELVSIFSNLFIMYAYLQNPKYEMTGRGVMLSTFTLALIHFYLHYKYLLM
ncbi:MAG: hypothetical protein KAG64_00045 [Bacteroidales bacterium]|nr:hypothetical protein [Bacteroidales bacterium]